MPQDETFDLTGPGGTSVAGGPGDDTYIVDDALDNPVELDGEGTDTVLSSIDWVLALYLERLVLTGSADIDGTGNALDNTLTGNTGANLLDGAAGVDTLDGGAGADTLIGGTGDDTYVVIDADTLTELANEGTDTVQSAITLTLAVNLENLLLTGAGTINGTGNTDNNTLTGNTANNFLSGDAGNDSLLGAAGNDTLDGGAGTDTLLGGAGDDTYVVIDTDTVTEFANEGTDTVQSLVSWTLGANLENLILLGPSPLNGTGNADANALTGNSGSNSLDGGGGADTLDGGAGTDTLVGGTGDDTYVVVDADTVTELANEGTDTLQSAITWILGANLENLMLTGASAISGTGNAGDNTLNGNAASNTLDGGAGTDTLLGGAGDDIYVVIDADTVTELANEGTDTVQSTITLTLAANVENLLLTGAGAVNGTGNTGNNTLTGNAAANTLDGGSGADTLLGGAGDDTYVVIDADTVTELANEGTDTVQSAISWTLGTNLENLVLTGASAISATGNTANNTLTGNTANNLLSGDAGDDSLVGAAGNDTLAGGGGTDTDTLKGGFGDDVYVVGGSDVCVEAANEGSDTVQSAATWTLAANFENLELTGVATANGTGNAADNSLKGNAASNYLSGGIGSDTLAGGVGNDTLDGGTGTDSMSGGGGDDIYLVSSGDIVREEAGRGVDMVRSSVTWKLDANIEKLLLTGSNAINGTGNVGNNTLTGNSAANRLDGGAGNDTLTGLGGNDTLAGGVGNDTYVVGPGDRVVELAGSGTDTVQSAANWTIAGNIERLVLTGSGAIDGIGNAVANTITGNAASNSLSGLGGADTLLGGAGEDVLRGGSGNDNLAGGADADVFVFETALSALSNRDTITDFATGSDTLQLDDDVFTALAVGRLSDAEFRSGAGIVAAQDADDRIIYDTLSGALYYDADGIGGTAALQFATLGVSSHPGLGADDFLIVG